MFTGYPVSLPTLALTAAGASETITVCFDGSGDFEDLYDPQNDCAWPGSAEVAGHAEGSVRTRTNGFQTESVYRSDLGCVCPTGAVLGKQPIAKIPVCSGDTSSSSYRMPPH